MLRTLIKKIPTFIEGVSKTFNTLTENYINYNCQVTITHAFKNILVLNYILYEIILNVVTVEYIIVLCSFLISSFLFFSKMTLQFSLWDKFKELNNMKMYQVRNLASFLSQCFTSLTLPLSVLKVSCAWITIYCWFIWLYYKIFLKIDTLQVLLMKFMAYSKIITVITNPYNFKYHTKYLIAIIS